MIPQNLSNKILFKALDKTKFGSLKLIILKPYAEYQFGEGPLVAEIRCKEPRTLNEIVQSDIALASALIREDLYISDEVAFIEWACKNADALKGSFQGQFIATLLPRIKRWLRPNTVDGAKRNIMEHYDLGNSFYNKWLDPSMSYSSGIFMGPQRANSLFEAQLQKYDRIIDELEITSKDHVLEIGCGWGGFFSRAVERTGCRVTAVMNSPSQAAHNRDLLKTKNLESQVKLELQDYRHIQGQFDKIVSIEMIEAVGQKYWPIYFDKVSSSLKSRGKALIQSITIREDCFAEYSNNPDFISTMIFPGGMLLTNQAISENASRAGIQSLGKPYEFGLCYAKTLSCWRENFLSAWDQNLFPEFDKKFANLWRFYLAYCEGAFKAQRINVGQFMLEKA